MAKPICRLTSNDASVTFVPANGEGPCVDLSASGGGGASGWTDDGTVVRLTTFTDLVGIGTVTPLAKLHVQSLTNNTPVQFWIDNADAPTDFFAVANGTGAATVFSATFFGQCSTTAQTGLFFVALGLDDVADTVPVTIFDSRGLGNAFLANRDPFAWQSFGAEYMRLSQAGFLGIGTTTPTEALDVTGNGTFSGTIANATDRPYISTGQTSSAGASVGTLTNSPTAGDPGFWLKVNINGTNYAIPAWLG